MVNDCLNRFWLLARAVGDNCSTLRTKVARQSLVVKGFAIAGPKPRSNLTRSRKGAKECGGSCKRSWLCAGLGEGRTLDGERLSQSFLAPGESSWGQLLYIADQSSTTVSVVKGCAISALNPWIISGRIVLGKTTAERRATIFSDHLHAKAQRSVVDLVKDPGSDGTWARAASLRENDCFNRSPSWPNR